MNIREIVFPVDFSGHSIAICPYVAAVTRCFAAKTNVAPRGGDRLLA